MVYPGDNRDQLNALELPIIIVTAIVSPIALPKANRTPAMIPYNAAGKITENIVFHLLAPIPYAAFLSFLGT